MENGENKKKQIKNCASACTNENGLLDLHHQLVKGQLSLTKFDSSTPRPNYGKPKYVQRPPEQLAVLPSG